MKFYWEHFGMLDDAGYEKRWHRGKMLSKSLHFPYCSRATLMDGSFLAEARKPAVQ